MLWKLLQLAIVFAVLLSNAEYQWTPNGYVAGGLAVFAAFAATVLLGDLFRLLRLGRQKAAAILGEQRADHGEPSRRNLIGVDKIVRKIGLHRPRH